MSYVKRLSLPRLMKLLDRAIEEIEKEKIFQLYLCDRPHLKEDKGFFEYHKKVVKNKKQIKVDSRPKDEIMREILGETNGTI